MLYKVRIQPAALRDAEEYAAFIQDKNLEPSAAARWYDGLTEIILSLGSMPARCPVIPEHESFKIEIRHLHYHSHRIIFHIDEDTGTVYVLRIYHGARDAIHFDKIDLP